MKELDRLSQQALEEHLRRRSVIAIETAVELALTHMNPLDVADILDSYSQYCRDEVATALQVRNYKNKKGRK